MECPTLGYLLNEMSSYSTQGDSYLRSNGVSVVRDFFCRTQKHGVDSLMGVRNILPEIRLLDRLVRDHYRVWLTLCIRSLFVYLSAIGIRILLLAAGSHGEDRPILVNDAAFMLLSVGCALVASTWLSYRFTIFGWNAVRRRKLWLFFQDYISLGRLSLNCPDIGPRLRAMLHDEWKSGLDATASREDFLRGRIQGLRQDLEKELESMSLIVIGAEFMAYLLGYFGFCFIPLVSTIESVSGI